MNNNLYYRFSGEKNAWLKENRKISFDDIVYYISTDCVIEIIPHPNQAKYKGQKIYVINIQEYIYLVPFVQEKDAIFLKTIYPSRKATKHYLGGDDNV